MSDTKRHVTFNMNDYVRVQLNESGKKIIRDKFASLKTRFPKFPGDGLPNEDADGWSRWQLWDLMRTFGPYISLGAENPFAIEIEFEA